LDEYIVISVDWCILLQLTCELKLNTW